MSAVEHIFKSLSKLPLQFDYYMPKPLFYPKHSNTIIISTGGSDINPGVFKYNLDNNNCEILQTCVDLQPDTHGHFIDYNNNTLHILDGYDLHITMDLETKIINNKHAFVCTTYPKCVQISSTKGD
eukprot:75519_1